MLVRGEASVVPQLLVDFFANPLVDFYVLRSDASQAE